MTHKRRLLPELEKARREKGINQSDLCISAGYYRAIVAGRRNPPGRTLLRLCTDERRGLGIKDISRLEKILGRTLTPDEKHEFLPLLSPKWPGLVAWYRFEDKGASDKSGYGNHGQLNGVRFVDDGAAHACSFNGSSYILVPHSSSLDLQNFTLSAWIKPTEGKGHRRILEKGRSGAYWLYLKDGMIWLGFLDIDDFCNVKSRRFLEPNRWHFVAGTFDGEELTLWVDGSVGDSIVSRARRLPAKNNDPLVLGWKYGGVPDDHFVGLIGEVQIYDRVLSVIEIRDLYNYGSVIHKNRL